MRKKAQGLSMQMIVIAIMALVVLIVVLFIFTGETGKFSRGVATIRDSAISCNNDLLGLGDQECIQSTVCPDEWKPIPAKCSKDTEICCKKE